MDIKRTPYTYFDRDEIERVGMSYKCLSCGYAPKAGELSYPIQDNLATSIDILRDTKVFSLDKIEKSLGTPQGYLSKAIKNKRALPKEWEATLKKYLLNLAKNINDKMG